MGQYFLPIVLGPDPCSPDGKHAQEFVRAWCDPIEYGAGLNIYEQADFHCGLVDAVEAMLSYQGPFWRSRFAWVGDYADPEYYSVDHEHRLIPVTLYDIAQQQGHKKVPPAPLLAAEGAKLVKYIVNNTKSLAALAAPDHTCLRPLPLLTAVGLREEAPLTNSGLIGSWARDVISVETFVPRGYTLIDATFKDAE